MMSLFIAIHVVTVMSLKPTFLKSFIQSPVNVRSYLHDRPKAMKHWPCSQSWVGVLLKNPNKPPLILPNKVFVSLLLFVHNQLSIVEYKATEQKQTTIQLDL